MKNPRIFVTVSPEMELIIKKIAGATDTSMSSVIGSVLDAQSDGLSQLASILEKARGVSMPLSRALTVQLGRRTAKAEKAALDAQESLDQFSLELDAMLDDQNSDLAATARTASAAVGAGVGRSKNRDLLTVNRDALPPLINKGAKNEPHTSKISQNGKAK